MNDFDKRIRVKLGKKQKEDVCVLGCELSQKTEIDTSKLKHSVLAYPLDVKKKGDGEYEHE